MRTLLVSVTLLVGLAGCGHSRSLVNEDAASVKPAAPQEMPAPEAVAQVDMGGCIPGQDALCIQDQMGQHQREAIEQAFAQAGALVPDSLTEDTAPSTGMLALKH
ncbi:hypothetical protein HPC49_10660 [Pyxidicoccus fallax]|uniref:Lipoprotein n=1 Tax=Pyxidicoccus fallax TaxID=394095 RepID=A0A848LCE6_9BACT|nr:hypothetical protein [Pyxidicoccus fallax]NMO16156.1 hypothetical protein [Pyxidicoccus fallax]NPC78703.1 hypothetical protein [Pyxidicoccus fallax]